MSTIINGTSSAITFPDTTVQNTAFTTGAVTQSTIANGVAGTGPAFSAYANTATSCSNGAFTTVVFDVEEFDTNNNFSSSTFTPTVAGYYQINASVNLVSAASSMLISLNKNGNEYKRGAFAYGSSLNNVGVSSIVYLNGSTDNVQIKIYQNVGGAVNTGTGIQNTWFNGVLVRAA